MKFEIKNRFTGDVIFTLETSSFKICVEAAIKSRANLSGADLYGADLYGADLSNTDLSNTNLSNANLTNADLSHTDLSNTNLSGADLSNTNLSNADLSNTDLSRTDLSGANLSNAKNAELIKAQQRITPEEGAFVGWKKLQSGVIAKLFIPHDAQRMNALGSRKCRASKAFVHEMFKDGDTFNDVAYGLHDPSFKYQTGKEVFPDSFNDDIREECSNGIHFFMTRAEAENYG